MRTIGYGSAGANDQLFPVPEAAAFHPLAFGQIAEDMWPAFGTYQVPPLLAPGTDFGSTPPFSGWDSGTATVQDYGVPTNVSESGNPWHLTKSPLVWVFVFLGVSLFVLHKVFWRGNG